LNTLKTQFIHLTIRPVEQAVLILAPDPTDHPPCH